MKANNSYFENMLGHFVIFKGNQNFLAQSHKVMHKFIGAERIKGYIYDTYCILKLLKSLLKS